MDHRGCGFFLAKSFNLPLHCTWNPKSEDRFLLTGLGIVPEIFLLLIKPLSVQWGLMLLYPSPSRQARSFFRSVAEQKIATVSTGHCGTEV